MDDQTRALMEIAVKALNAALAATENKRHRELVKMAAGRVRQTMHDIEADETIAAVRRRGSS